MDRHRETEEKKQKDRIGQSVNRETERIGN